MQGTNAKKGSAKEPAKTFQDLLIWQSSHHLVLDIYRISREFPKSEQYSLTSQVRRAAISVPANIAEGFKKKGRADKARYLNVAQGSLEESRYYLILIQGLGYGETEKLMARIEEISKMLEAYINSILTSGS